MKKLMMAVAIVCAAAFAQGAAVQWKSSNMANHAGGTVAAKDMTMYVWEIGSDAYSTLQSKAALGAEELSKYIAANYDYKATEEGKPTIFKDSSKSSSTKSAMSVTGADDKTPKQNVYAAILIVDNKDGYVMGNLYHGEVPESGPLVTGNLGTNLGGDTQAAATAWVSVPEPTSGLLLLLGVAGLALRRRRA